jgi:hypothetical protein
MDGGGDPVGRLDRNRLGAQTHGENRHQHAADQNNFTKLVHKNKCRQNTD